MSKNFFSYLIDTGQFRVDDEGRALLFGEFLFLIPPSVIIKLRDILIEENGQKKAEEILFKLGKFQVQQGAERYMEKYDLNEKTKDDVIDFTSNIFKVLGWGNIEIENLDLENNDASVIVKSPVFPEKYLETKDKNADNPICSYLEGLFSKAFSGYMGQEIRLKEKSCAAVTGEKYCKFVTE